MNITKTNTTVSLSIVGSIIVFVWWAASYFASMEDVQAGDLTVKQEAYSGKLNTDLEVIQTQLKLYADIQTRRPLNPDEQLTLDALKERQRILLKALGPKEPTAN